jgi:hypothetical protein
VLSQIDLIGFFSPLSLTLAHSLSLFSITIHINTWRRTNVDR